MGDGRDLPPEHRAQLDAFLRWREDVRRQAARRRRWARRVTVASLAVTVVALVAWVAESARDTRERVTEEGRAPMESAAAASPEPARPSAPPAGPTQAEALPAEPQMARPPTAEPQEVTAPPTVPSRQQSPPRSPVAKARIRTPDADGGAHTTSPTTGDEAIPPPAWISTVPAASDPTAPLPEDTVAERSEPVVSAARPDPSAEDPPIVARPPSKPETAETTVASPDAPDAKVERGGAAPPVAGPRPPKSRVIGDKVVGWLEGEVQEVRDTARREIGEFRAGFDKVLSCLAWIRAESASSCKSAAPRRP